MSNGTDRIRCTRCGANNFPGRPTCFQCGASLPPPEVVGVSAAAPPALSGSPAWVPVPGSAPRAGGHGIGWVVAIGAAVVVLAALMLFGVQRMRAPRGVTEADQAKAKLEDLQRQLSHVRPPSISDPNALAPDPLRDRAQNELERLKQDIRQRNPGLAP